MPFKKIEILAGALLAATLLAAPAQAQSAGGTLVVVPASGDVVRANDQVVARFFVEETDKDKTLAASRVNEKMKQGADIVRKADPQAVLKSYGYYTYPVYPELKPLASGETPVPPASRVPVAWRIGQYLEVKTTNLANLPKTTAAAQKVLALNGLQFGLAPATIKLADEQRIATAWRNLNERIASIAAAMGRNVGDAVIELVDFEGSGKYAGGQTEAYQAVAVTGARNRAAQEVAEPSFEPGETTLNMRLVGKVKFK